MSKIDGQPDPNRKEICKNPQLRRGQVIAAVALAAAFAIGGGVTAAALQHRQPTMLLLSPAPIASMHEGESVAIKGQVAEIFGNKFVVQDGSGRALVETGPKGERTPLVAKSETVTVQGRFETGFIHAQTISHADGRNEFVGPAGPPPRPGPRGAKDGPHGPKDGAPVPPGTPDPT